MNLMHSAKNPWYLQSSLTCFLFFCSWGIWWAFFQLWLTSERAGLMLSGGEVGTVYSVNSITSLILMLLYGMAQDRLGIKRNLLIAVAAIAMLIGPFATWVYRPLLATNLMMGAIVGSLVLSAGFIAGCSLVEALTERFSRRFNFEYGQARAWGSFGYAVVALVGGFLFSIDPSLNFWVGSLFGLAMLLNVLLWRPRAEREADHAAASTEAAPTPSFRQMLSLLRIPMLWALIVFVVFSWTFYTVFDQQMFPDFYTHLFESPEQGQRFYGTLSSVQVFLESAMMGLVPVIMRKVGVRNTLLLAMVVMFIRLLGCATFTNPIVISLVKMLSAVEVPMFSLPIFRYFTLHFNPSMSATLYMIGDQIAAQLGTAALSTPLGSLRDAIGYHRTFLIITGIVFAAAIYAWFILKKDDEHVEGDPFVRDK
ncbi:MFS transporter [Bifidobacterium oedipodis]|uniref:Galactoside permease n=1 Tax=Bifidobacterium oedipodis TaxID=2675322 RepID=A0A7Y0EQT7_9BIFI|nr:MFS transporter [Bifidobacterium sp. DSM 109957]NMM94748.1 galactoside permease [Bifidobacterium sp. DSM 109957]